MGLLLLLERNNKTESSVNPPFSQNDALNYQQSRKDTKPERRIQLDRKELFLAMISALFKKVAMYFTFKGTKQSVRPHLFVLKIARIIYKAAGAKK